MVKHKNGERFLTDEKAVALATAFHSLVLPKHLIPDKGSLTPTNAFAFVSSHPKLLPKELRDLLKGGRPLGHMLTVQGINMKHFITNIAPHGNSVGFQLFHNGQGIAQQHFVTPHREIHGRKAVILSEHGRHIGVGTVGVSHKAEDLAVNEPIP